MGPQCFSSSVDSARRRKRPAGSVPRKPRLGGSRDGGSQGDAAWENPHRRDELGGGVSWLRVDGRAKSSSRRDELGGERLPGVGGVVGRPALAFTCLSFIRVQPRLLEASNRRGQDGRLVEVAGRIAAGKGGVTLSLKLRLSVQAVRNINRNGDHCAWKSESMAGAIARGCCFGRIDGVVGSVSDVLGHPCLPRA